MIIRLQQSLDKHKQTTNNSYDIGFSYGMVSFDPDKHHTIEVLLKDGDSQMYEHKNEK